MQNIPRGLRPLSKCKIVENPLRVKTRALLK